MTGRFEIANKEEHVKALTVGYTKDVYRTTMLLGGVGGNVTVYDAPGPRPLSVYAWPRRASSGEWPLRRTLSGLR